MIALYRYQEKTVDVSESRTVEQEEEALVQRSRADRLAAAGFVEQARQLRDDLAEAEAYTKGVHPALWYPTLRLDEYRVWAWFLPRAYSQFRCGDKWASWSGYRFDRVPDEVLEELAFCKGLNLFASYIIRTPESPRSVDPILLGRRENGAYYFVARWGESLLPFEDLCRQYRLAQWKAHPLQNLRKKVRGWMCG